MSAVRSDLEENGTQDAKVSDSGYSNSCRNSQSQRSTGSSQSRHSSSSGSSGYCGHQPNLGSITETPPSSKKKKAKVEKATDVLPPVPVITKEEPPTQIEADEGISLNAIPPTGNGDALQIAALAQTLTCIKKLKHKENDIEVRTQLTLDDRTQEHILNCLKTDINEEEMQIVVSMQDGVVLYTSCNLVEVLGYPKDMWVGRSLIDFVHPRHRMSFASHITSVIASSQPELYGNNKAMPGLFFCCLRQYRGLKTTGFSVTDKRVSYVPCQMSIVFRELQPAGQEAPGMFLVIATTPVRSVYKYPEESKINYNFTMRHCSSTLVCHVDAEVAQYLGYLPQDLIGQSILDLYHPDDLMLIKQVYYSVMNEQRQPLRCRPYRFRCQNGDFVLMETEWSAFINPWSRKLEFMIGHHSILKGPPHPDVVTPVEQEVPQSTEDQLKELKKIQDEIKGILTANVVCGTETAKQQVSKRCKDLANFMETLMDEITKPLDLKVEVHLDDEKSFSERDSVMLGEISPHHDYYDSKSASETPPSYNQLNYKENLQRFFESKPKTTLSDESAESKNGAPNNFSSGGEDDKSTPQNNPASHINHMTSTEGSGGESSGGGQSSSGGTGVSNKRPLSPAVKPVEASPAKPQNMPQYNLPLLTERLLNKHNEDMEKKMVQKHREQRSKTGDSKSKDKYKNFNLDKLQEDLGCHGVKRSGSNSFEGEPFKSIKASHCEEPYLPTSTSHATLPVPAHPQINSSVNIWPPFSMSVAPLLSRSRNVNGGPPLQSPLIPMYYLPAESRPNSNQNYNPFITTQGGHGSNFVPGMMYQPIAMLGPPASILYSPLTVLPTPVFPPQPPMKPAASPQQPQCVRCEVEGGGRPGSQATSVKAQPGSVATSTSHRQTVSEHCKSSELKTLADQDSFGTSNLCDDSSCYSSYGSFPFMKTDKSDESMKSSPENDGKSEDMSWEKSDRNHGSPKNRPVKMVAPWMQAVNVTPELTLRYQLKEKGLEELLKSDIQTLDKIVQPSLVNDQLCQMYNDLELEGLSKYLTLEEGITSSSSDSSPDDPHTSEKLDKKKKNKYMEYDKMAILYEENAPLPPPAVAPVGTVECS